MRRSRLAVVAALFIVLASCGGGAARQSTTTSTTTSSGKAADVADLPAVKELLDAAAPLHRYSVGTDRLGVWVCHVPVGIKDPIYNPVDFRLPIHASEAAAKLEQYVAPFFASLSNSVYRPKFVAGGDISITVDQTNSDCVQEALRRAGADIDGVFVVADAEHAENAHGGWGTPGDACHGASSCPARLSGRAAYIGASDFHPDWGKVPAVDLSEHEIGHTLGFPHSGGGDGYTSGIDLMSNSASPRDVDAKRRNGPDTLGVNLLAAGWLPESSVVTGANAGTYELSPSNSASGQRLLVLPVDEHRFLTVEVLDKSGFDDYLPHSGLVVHEIDQSPTACRSGTATQPCLNEYRSQFPLSGTAPYTDLLGSGATWSGMGWSITITGPVAGKWTIQTRQTK